MSPRRPLVSDLLRLRRIAGIVFTALSATIVFAPSAGSAQTDGALLFAQNCSACHQLTGKGIPGAFPALAGDVLVNGPPQGPATVVLNGRGGMPTFGKDLSDQDIAAILSYVRSAWGNHAGPVGGAVVKALRTNGEPSAEKFDAQAH